MTDFDLSPDYQSQDTRPVAAGWWRRAKAVIIDMLLWSAAEVLPVALAVVGLVMAVDEAADDGSAVVGWVLFAVGVAVFVAVVVWAGWLFGYRQGVTGTTPGKRRLGIRLIDIETGETVWSDVLPAGGQANPIAYEVDGKQYVMIAATGHHFMETPIGDYLIAYALP